MPLVNESISRVSSKVSKSVSFEELFGSGYEKLMERVEEYDFEEGISFRDFALRDIAGAVRNYQRTLGVCSPSFTRVRDSGSVLAAFPDRNSYDERDRKEFFESVFDRLDERERVIFRLRYVFGFSFDKICQSLDLTRQTISKVHKYALARLQGEFNRSFFSD